MIENPDYEETTEEEAERLTGDEDLKEENTELVSKITEKLLDVLKDVITDEEIADKIAPVIPSLVELGLKEGQETAEHVLAGLASGDTYPHWKILIQASSYQNRIIIMESGRQAAIEDIARKLEQDKRAKEVLSIILKVLFSILPLLL